MLGLSDRRLIAVLGLSLLWQALIPTGWLLSLERGDAASRQTDASDDFRLQLIYARPKDAEDRGQLREDGILNSVASAQRWLEDQTDGHRLRFVGRDGRPTILRVDLTRTDAEYRAYGINAAFQMEYELRAQGLSEPGIIYVVYYDGSGEDCGLSPIPPENSGKTPTLLLKGAVAGSVPCEELPFAEAGAAAGYWEFLLLHEVFHALGAVPNCAPHADGEHHLNDPRDLMHKGPDRWQPEFLDRDRDDYFGHARSDCYDLSRSPYLRPLPDNAEPAPQLYQDRALVVPCAQDDGSKAAEDDKVSVRFINLSGEPIDLYWVDLQGASQYYASLAPWDQLDLTSYLGLPFRLLSADGECLGSYLTGDEGARVWIEGV